MKKETGFSLKDQLFNKEKIEKLAAEIAVVHPSFRKNDFINDVSDGLPERELKERIVWIQENLRRYLPKEYRDAVKVLLDALPEELATDVDDNDFGDFIYAPYSNFVAVYGCTEEDLMFSLEALKEMTKRFSAEDAIRFFLRKYPDQTLDVLWRWAHDTNYHVRRLTSEGTRPILPWCGTVDLDHNKTMLLLDHLHSDRTRYVVRSVANHLNDITKTHPERVIAFLQKWRREGLQDPKELDYLTGHALRTLVKRGHPGALRLLGYSTQPDISISSFLLEKDSIAIGEELKFSFTLTAHRKERLMLDYVITFLDKRGMMSREKVFKISRKDMQADEVFVCVKTHPMRLMTTWALYPGSHQIAMQINGKRSHEYVFDLRS